MPTQAEIYAALPAGLVDDELSWTEAELPERVRTKHVHRLHPYLGKYVPQLVEVFLRRHVRPGQAVLDPFAGSGTTLVEATTFGVHAAGADISAFNALLARVKTRAWDAERAAADLEAALARFCAASAAASDVAAPAAGYLADWFAPAALADLLRYRALVADYPASADLLRVVLSRAARSARLAPHHQLDFPRVPQREPYRCRKHRRECRPTEDAAKFLRRYSADTARRVAAYAALRRDVRVDVHHADARGLDWGGDFDALVTSPPYPGRIDYHDQHRYAFELLGLPDRAEEEIGAGARGRSRRAVADYVDGIAATLATARRHLVPGAPVVIVVEDGLGLYGEILERAGLELEERRRRHVNRRTGARGGEYFEDVLLARA